MLKNSSEPRVHGLKLKNSIAAHLSAAFCFLLLFCGLTFCLFAEEQFSYDSQGRRDPFVALVTSDGRLLNLEPQGEVEGIMLEGIIYHRDGDSYAIVNGDIVKENDKIGKYEVKKIEEKKVIFAKEGQNIEVELEKEER